MPAPPFNPQKLVDVAQGIQPADMVIRNAELVNVYTGELMPQQSVAIADEWIAYVGDKPEPMIGDGTHVIDAQGKTIVPGLIEGHTHTAWLFAPHEFLKHAIPGGTTSVITETLEPFPVCGYGGVIDFLDALQDQPIKIWATVPPMVSISPTFKGIPLDTLRQLLERPEVIGLGESYWHAVLQRSNDFLPIFQTALQSGKRLEGHSAGASHYKLNAYVATGVSSCHEPIKADEVLDRLRLGLHVMIREGSIRRDLDNIVSIVKPGIDCRRMVLSTDGVTPKDLLSKGFIEHAVQKAIDLGVDPVCAIQMATLNVAEHFKLDHLIGGLAPGHLADILVLPDVKTIDPEYVISNGCIVAHNRKLAVSPRAHAFKPESTHSVHLHTQLTEADFEIAFTEGDTAKVRAIEMVTDLVTREVHMTLPVKEQRLLIDPQASVAKIAAIDRTHSPGKTFVGVIKDFGLRSGAIASSAAWDTSDIVVVGSNGRDMASAVNRIHTLQGGAVVCREGKVLAELPLPIFGLMSDLPVETLVRKLDDIAQSAHDLGVPFDDPLLTLITLTGAAIPFLRVCEDGLVSLKDGKKVPLFVES